MQTTSQIQSQINQVEREVKDIERAISRLSSTQDLLDSHQEISNRQNVLVLLENRLVTARQREEREQAERARLELETKRDTAKDEIERLNAEFDTLLAPLERLLSEVLPKLFEIARARRTQQSRYSELSRTLRGGSPDELGLDILVGNYGFTVKNEQDSTKLRRLLLVLYRDFIGVAGGFKSLTQPMPVLSVMAQIDTPTPHKHTDTLGSHLQELGL